MIYINDLQIHKIKFRTNIILTKIRYNNIIYKYYIFRVELYVDTTNKDALILMVQEVLMILQL